MWKSAQAGAGDDVADRQHDPGGIHGRVAAQQRDQHEEQFARVHVAEQSHAERDRLGDELDQVAAGS